MCKLCGGTLLVLLGHSSKKSSTDTSLLSGMLKVMKHDIYIDNTTLKEQTKKFKICKEHSSLATPFEVPSVQKKITDDIKKNYTLLLKRTTKFINDHIDTDSEMHKDELLVKAVLELIAQDKSISDEQEFYILPNGKSVKKSKLPFMIKFYLPSFLLGILYYVMMNIKDNKDGAETYDKWCPKPKSGTQRKYAANIGENSKRQITLIDAPEDYVKSELLSLTDELSLLYVKKFPTEKEYDITDVSFVATDHISDINSEEYNRLELNPQDHINLQSFINDYNTLIDNVNKYSECNNIDELNLLENTKLHFFNVWLQNRVSFENQEVDNLFKDILKRIKASNKINISKIKHYIGKPITIPTLDTLPASCQISSTRKMPTIHMCLYNKNVNDNPPKAPQEETDTIAPSDNNCTSK